MMLPDHRTKLRFQQFRNEKRRVCQQVLLRPKLLVINIIGGASRLSIRSDGIVGVTCHDSRHLAMEAGEAGADYVAFGAFYPTSTKDGTVQATPDLLEVWQESMEIPCVAIGGITVDNAAPLVTTGADFIAVSSGVWDHPDGAPAAIAAFNRILDELDQGRS